VTIVRQLLCLCLLFEAAFVQADDVIRLGNLKLAHFGAVSYMKEIAPKCGIKIEEYIFAKGTDKVFQASLSSQPLLIMAARHQERSQSS